MSSTVRFDFGQEGNPGPGQYTPNSSQTLRSNPAFTMKGNGVPDLNREKVPGPGAYEPSITAIKSKNGAFTMASRHGTGFKNTNPGPGAYEGSNAFISKKAPSYTLAPRHNRTKPQETPGPNVYNKAESVYAIKRTDPSYTLSSRFQKLEMYGEQNKVPGPNKYNALESTKMISRKAPSFTVGNKDNFDQYKAIKANPAPNTYQTNLDGVKHNVGSTMSGRFKRGWRME